MTHEYCYSKEHGRKCMAPDRCMQDAKCGECGKPISDCEWVVGWGACGDCIAKFLDGLRLASEKPPLP